MILKKVFLIAFPGRRVPQEEGVLEVGAKISLERRRILEQETLIKKVNANPWFIYDYDQGITRLKWPTGAYVVSEYGDGRVKTTSWLAVPAKLKHSLSDMGPETWICHPFSGFSVYFFLKVGEVAVYTRLDNMSNLRTGYKSGFGDAPALLYYNQSLIDAEFRSEDFIDFPMPGPKDKRAKKPSPKDMSDEEYVSMPRPGTTVASTFTSLMCTGSLSTLARTSSSLWVASPSCTARICSTIFA